MATFKKGTSGNPKGRPVGKTPGAQLRKSIEFRADDILQAVINSAIGGDMTACKILLDLITPTLKPQTMPIFLPVNGTLAEQGNEIIRDDDQSDSTRYWCAANYSTG